MCFVTLLVSALFRAGENIVGTHMKNGDTDCTCGDCEMIRTERVHKICARRVASSLLHLIVCRRVEDDVRLHLFYLFLRRLTVGDVEAGMIAAESDECGREGAHEVVSELPIPTNDKNAGLSNTWLGAVFHNDPRTLSSLSPSSTSRGSLHTSR